MSNQYFYIPSMASTQLLQVKLVLTETVREAKKQIYTQNGLTVDQEFEILKRDKEIQKAHWKGGFSPKSFSTLIRELNA